MRPPPSVRRTGHGPVPGHARGAGLLSLLGFAAAAVLGIYTLFLVVPVYAGHYAIHSAVQSLATLEPVPRNSREVREALRRRLQVNGIRSLERDAVQVERTAGGLEVSVVYDRQRHWLGNVDLLFHFRTGVRIPTDGAA